jgi:hypothetical protein
MKSRRAAFGSESVWGAIWPVVASSVRSNAEGTVKSLTAPQEACQGVCVSAVRARASCVHIAAGIR